jgi:SAM-dependent methyltransferase
VSELYTRRYYLDLAEHQSVSATRLVPHIIDVLGRPRAVVDVGCGPGGWLAEFGRHGASTLLGIDSPGLDRALLTIPSSSFLSWDLTREVPDLGRTFDLVVSLEVAEHLPPSSADTFVASLVKLGETVVFSAAIPGQGGTQHVNEQWPAYWAERFERFGYRAIDCLRPRVWRDARLDWWYAQNTVVYASEERVRDGSLKDAYARFGGVPLALVHPRNYARFTA